MKLDHTPCPCCKPYTITTKVFIPKNFQTQNRAELYFFHYNRKAWTGGDTPKDDLLFSDAEYLGLVKFFFREQLKECGGLDLWACAGTSALDRARIFWNRAKLDAYATLKVN